MQYTLNTIARKLSDWKIIIGFAVVVLGTLGNLAFNFINYTVNTRNAPIVSRIEAIESRDVNIEKALMDGKTADTRLESKVDRILLKLIPNANINYSQ
jgi:hypothetical protein